jgi:hypothetical protein
MQMSYDATFGAWVPWKTYDHDLTPIPPHVQASFYGNAFAADFIGSQGNFCVCNLPQPAENDHISAYAGYNDDKLSKVAITNLELRTAASNSGTRPSTTATVKLPGLNGDITQVREALGRGWRSPEQHYLGWEGLAVQ